METQARYIVVGLSALLAVLAAFAVVVWLHGVGGVRGQSLYRIRFDAPVIGLKPGVAVLFNGLRVGEVTSVKLDPADPKLLISQIAVDPTTPVRKDTEVGIDSQGFLGDASVSLRGGASSAVLVDETNGQPPLLIADSAESVSLGQAGKAALAHLDVILTQNTKTLHAAIEDIGKFAAVLAKNSDRVDGIVAGLAKMTGGGEAKSPPLSYNLAAAEFSGTDKPSGKSLTLQIAVPEPTAVVALETQRVLIAPRPNELQPLEAGQWADSTPKLVQTGIVRSFENAGFAHIAITTDGFTPDVQLLLELRSFQLSVDPQPVAQVEIYAKLLGADGKIVASREFQASIPATGADIVGATNALNQAFKLVAGDLVAWAVTAM